MCEYFKRHKDAAPCVPPQDVDEYWDNISELIKHFETNLGLLERGFPITASTNVGESLSRRKLRSAHSSAVPAMPCTSFVQGPHRPKLSRTSLQFFACVARPVSKREMEENPKAMEACEAEWKRLWEKEVWDASVVHEWDDLARSA